MDPKTATLLVLLTLPSLVAASDCDNGLAFVGWYIFDDHTEYETTSNPAFVVSEHGDTDLYYYEPSGGHGMMAPGMDDQTAFSAIERYIRQNVGEGSLKDTFSYDTTSTLATFERATYTYALAYLMIPPGSTGSFTLKLTKVDDGMSLLVNGRQIAFHKLNDGSGEFDLDRDINGNAGVLKAGKNTVIIILVDDSKREKYIRGLQFLYNGQLIAATPDNTISGYVTSGAQPLSGAEVTASGAASRTTTTDATGFYSLGCMPDGTYVVTAEKECYDSKSSQVSVSGNQVRNQDFALTADQSCVQPLAQPSVPPASEPSADCCDGLEVRIQALEYQIGQRPGPDGTATAALILAILALVLAIFGDSILAALKKQR